MTLEGFFARGVLPVEFLSFLKFPVHGPIGEPTVILRIEIRRHVLRVPAQVGFQQVLGWGLSFAAVHCGVDPEAFQKRVVLGGMVLPHDDRVVPPFAVGRPSDEGSLRVFFPVISLAFLVHALQREMDG